VAQRLARGKRDGENGGIGVDGQRAAAGIGGAAGGQDLEPGRAPFARKAPAAPSRRAAGAVPADMIWTSPASVRPSLPRLSRWVIAPARTKVTISMSRCPCGSKPVPGAISSSFQTRRRPQPIRAASR
jgi:hypothetical protein